MAKFNGAKNWNHWNVSLWINNDVALYNLARNYKMDARHRGGYTQDDVAKAILSHFAADGHTKTPDGAPYSVSSIKAAIKDM